MSQKMNPCIWANNNAKEMAEFYVSIFDDIIISHENPSVVIVEISGQKIMLLNGGDHFKPNPSVSLHLNCDTETEVEKLSTSLLEGGFALMALGEYPWSKKYAWIQDKYSVNWQLYFTPQKQPQKLVPTLMFINKNAGKATEAMEFYTSVFPASKINNALHYDGKEDKEGFVQHAAFTLCNYTMYCMDSSYDHKFDFDEGVSIVVHCKDQEEIDNYWSALTSNGGQESMCGWLKDKYGLSWQIVPVNMDRFFTSPETAKNVMDAVMKMKKLDIAEMEKAAQG